MAKKVWTPSEMGKKGAKVRNKRLSARRRSEIARTAALSRKRHGGGRPKKTA
jgi:hypothetical protein